MDISFELAAKHSPQFRSSINVFMHELDDLEIWLRNITTTQKLYLQSFSKTNETGLVVGNRVTANKSLGLIRDLSSVHTVAEALMTLHSINLKVVDNLQDNVISVIEAYIAKDIRDIREDKKAYDKAVEKYDIAVAKYYAASKTRSQSVLIE
eukprot:jgi/Hompol1/1576/HPOL_005644-RA